MLKSKELFELYIRYLYPNKQFNQIKLKNIYKIKKNDFDVLEKIIYKSFDHIDENIFLYSNAINYKFNSKMLIQKKSLLIYQKYIDICNNEKNVNKINKLINNSILNIVKYCKYYNINTFEDYLLNTRNDLIPLLCRNYYSGAICKYLLYLIPNISNYINMYSKDIKDDYFNDFNQQYLIYKSKLIKVNSFRKLTNNINNIINNKIKEI